MSCKKNYVATLLIALILGIGMVQPCACNASDLVGSNGKYVSVLKSQVMEAPPKPDKLGKMAQKYHIKAENGDVNAQLIVALSYSSGIGEYPVDNRAACYWFHRAAVQGNIKAQLKLAQMFGKGDGVEKNIPEAMYWYEQIASYPYIVDNYSEEADDIFYSRMKLGDYYYTGIGCEQDFSKAYEYYQQAYRALTNSSYGGAEIILRIGLCSMYGRGCDLDGEWAVSTFNEIVSGKGKYGKRNMYYQRFPKVSLDYSVSLNYYYLGRCYCEGIGCQRNIKLARKYFAQAKKMIPYANKVLAEKA